MQMLSLFGAVQMMLLFYNCTGILPGRQRNLTILAKQDGLVFSAVAEVFSAVAEVTLFLKEPADVSTNVLITHAQPDGARANMAFMARRYMCKKLQRTTSPLDQRRRLQLRCMPTTFLRLIHLIRSGGQVHRCSGC